MLAQLVRSVAAFGLICLSAGYADASDFSNPALAASQTPLKLYATRYYVHYVHPATDPKAVPLLKPDGSSIGVSVSAADFCFGALQGTIKVQSDSGITIYNVDGLTKQRSTTCSYRSLKPAVNDALGLQAWAKVTGNGIYGLGVDGLRLVPFRTVAVDRKAITIGTVLYIPALKGFEFDTESGRQKHDGYVIAGDVGGGVKGNHIDFFTGNYTGPVPKFITSKSDGIFTAQVVTDPAIVAALRDDAKYRP